MNYLALARKWRPQTFTDVVGQQHALLALKNALDRNRLHHAYLFTGTRGVGKTTLARLIAKSLNCEQGISSNPCNVCSTCQDISKGRFADLLEIDAASRTKVEDTREILDNVFYAPARGRFKIYLIDEVHMLSGHSFNALLKTLEEPPPHVKFLLATTDPEKLPITILSRCLQFHLKPLTTVEIVNQLMFILNQEQIGYDELALQKIAKVASGSMRDALSLLDQAIAFTSGKIDTATVVEMLGVLPKLPFKDLFQAILQENGVLTMQLCQQIADQTPCYEAVLDEIITLFHQLSMVQIVPETIDFIESSLNTTELKELAEIFPSETVQLFYQIALLGRRDLPLAPHARLGFEMVILRMLAFNPDSLPEKNTPQLKAQCENSQNKTQNSTSATPTKESQVLITSAAPVVSSEWETITANLKLNSLARSLAENTIIKSIDENHLHLLLDKNQAVLLNPFVEKDLQTALNHYFQKNIKLTITLSEEEINSKARQQKEVKKKTHTEATLSLKEDQHLQKILTAFNVTIDDDAIKPLT